jgi:hypothetical protein
MAPRSLSRQARRPHRCGRRRRCLLKGCGQWFQPTHPQCRYCSVGCREAARRWRRWHAQQRYRSSRHGREHRQQQARRYRQRCRNRPPPGAAAATAVGSAAVARHRPRTPCEGKRPAKKEEEVPLCPCGRPGCYVLFPAGTASNPRRFCCALCRQALRGVLEREARWRRRRRRGLRPPGRRARPPRRGP